MRICSFALTSPNALKVDYYTVLFLHSLNASSATSFAQKTELLSN
ncbi:MAG: hypothetical protein PUF08_08805 [Clostridiales bacterium]|nr:hypothetical protein [Clostridiales bacterium]